MSGGSSAHQKGADVGRLLETLREDSETRGPANPANPANNGPIKPEGFADSQDSRRVRPSITARLLAIAIADGIDAGDIYRLDSDDLAGCDGLSDETLRDWLRLRASCRICQQKQENSL